MRIRTAKPEDAEKLVRLIADAENSNFMLFEPGERKLSANQLKERIKAMENEKTSAILLAEMDNELLGYLFIIGNSPERVRHAAYLAIGISGKNRGTGVGTKLFERLEDWAKETKISRLELTVMIHNRAGLGLYQKSGFKIEGIKKNSLMMDGEYIDEYYMAKLI